MKFNTSAMFENIIENDKDKDLGVIYDSGIKFKEYIVLRVTKANAILGIIRQSRRRIEELCISFFKRKLQLS